MSMMAPNAGNAPPFSAGQTPDARPVSLGEALNVALQELQAEPLTGDTMYQLKAFFLASQKILQAKAAGAGAGGGGGAAGAPQPGAPMGPNGAGPPAPATSADTEDYGSGFGSPVQNFPGRNS